MAHGIVDWLKKPEIELLQRHYGSQTEDKAGVNYMSGKTPVPGCRFIRRLLSLKNV